jgi:hypothetical protein
MTKLEVFYWCIMVYCFLALIVSPFSFWIAEDSGWAGEKQVYLNEYKWHAKIWLFLKSFLIIAIISLILCIPALLLALVLLGLFATELLSPQQEIEVKTQ